MSFVKGAFDACHRQGCAARQYEMDGSRMQPRDSKKKKEGNCGVRIVRTISILSIISVAVVFLPVGGGREVETCNR